MGSVKQLEVAKRKREEKLKREHKLIKGVDHKLCNKHHIYFPNESPWIPATLEYFYYHEKNTTDYLHPNCKKCGVIKADIWKKDNPEKYKEIMIKVEAKPSRKRDNRGRATKQRLAGKQKIWQRNNPEKLKQYTLNHRQHDITESEWRSCLKVFNNTCAYCGLPYEQHIVQRNGKYIVMNLHKDHVDHEGYNDLRNAIPSCRSCNDKKWAFPMEEWYREQEYFTEDRLNFINWWVNEGYKEYIENKLPYRILKEKNKDNNKFHWNLWTIDEKRNMVKVIATRSNRKEIINELKKGIIKTPEIVII